jgi:hypothetical protein
VFASQAGFGEAPTEPIQGLFVSDDGDSWAKLQNLGEQYVDIVARY